MAEDGYFPPAQDRGGWRTLTPADDIRGNTGMLADRLDELRTWAETHLGGAANAGLVVRHGYVVRQWGGDPGRHVSIKSAAKAFAALATGLAIDDSRRGHQAAGHVPPLDYDRPAYQYISEGHPLSSPGKARITVRQLIHHVGGILPECTGVSNRPPEGAGFWEFVLGLHPDFPTARLYAEPGTKFLYGTYDIRHLPLIIHTATGMELENFARERLYAPCGATEWTMLRHGGKGTIGPHSDMAMSMSARDFARLGYLMLRGGV